MGGQMCSKTVLALLIAGGVLVLVGCSLMWNYSYVDDTLYILPTMTRSSLRYNTCYFFFIFLSSCFTAYLQRASLLAITSGLFAAILTFSFSLTNIDNIRIILDLQKGDRHDELMKLSAGVIIAYIGSGLAFIASVLVFDPHREGNSVFQSKPASALMVLIVLFAFMGSICIWQSQDIAFGTPTRFVFFDSTCCTIAVVIIFMIGVFGNVVLLQMIAATLSAFYNLSILDVYLQVPSDGLKEKDTDCAGMVFLWLSAVGMVFYCAVFQPTGSGNSSYHNIESDSSTA